MKKYICIKNEVEFTAKNGQTSILPMGTVAVYKKEFGCYVFRHRNCSNSIVYANKNKIEGTEAWENLN